MNVVLSTLAIKTLKAIYKADRANVYVNPHDVTFLIYVRTPAFQNAYWKFQPTNQFANKLDRKGNPIQVPITIVTLRQHGKRDAAGKVINDGANFAPDSPKGVKPGFAIHDPGYLSINDMTQSWYTHPYNPGPLFSRDLYARIGSKTAANDASCWTEADIRQLMDSIFGATIRFAGGRPWIVRTYYSACRHFGGIFRTTKELKAHNKFLKDHAKLLVLCASLVGLTGCNGCMSPPDIVDFPSGLPMPERVESGDLSGDVFKIIREATKQ